MLVLVLLVSRRRAHSGAAGAVRFLRSGPDSGDLQTHTEISLQAVSPDSVTNDVRPGLLRIFREPLKAIRTPWTHLSEKVQNLECTAAARSLSRGCITFRETQRLLRK